MDWYVLPSLTRCPGSHSCFLMLTCMLHKNGGQRGGNSRGARHTSIPQLVDENTTLWLMEASCKVKKCLDQATLQHSPVLSVSLCCPFGGKLVELPGNTPCWTLKASLIVVAGMCTPFLRCFCAFDTPRCPVWANSLSYLVVATMIGLVYKRSFLKCTKTC